MTDKKDETKKDEVKAPQAAVAIQVNDRGLVLKTLDDMWRYANYVVRAGIAPKGFETPEGVVVALQAGAEHRLTPMQSLQCIAVINKRPCFYGDAVPGMVESSGLQEYGFSKKVGERNPDGSYPDAYGYRYTTKRKGRDEYSYDFLVTDAKKAKLWGKEGPWTFYPDRMLLNRARTFCIRDVYPDVMAGLLTVDEANNIVNADYEVVDDDKSRTDQLADIIAPEPPQTEPKTSETPETKEDSPTVDKNTGEVRPPESPPSTETEGEPMTTPKESALIYSTTAKVYNLSPAEALMLASAIVKRKIDIMKDLTLKEAKWVNETLSHKETTTGFLVEIKARESGKAQGSLSV